VPFGGKYRVVDFVLSNFINSGIYSIYVLTQFKSQSLLQHLSEGWQFGSLLKTSSSSRVAPRVVPGHRRRDLSKRQPDRAVGPPPRGHLRRRPIYA